MWFLRRIRTLRSLQSSPKAPSLARSHRSRLLRPLALILMLALLLGGGLALVLSNPAHAASDNKDYLALGDSVAFGYNPLVQDKSNPNNFIGYPTPVAQTLDMNLTNAACPGATSSYLISLSGPDWECIPYRSVYPLHVNYATSQIDFAVSFLQSHPRTRLITINIGANDLFRLQAQCIQQDPSNPIPCVQANLPQLLKTLAANLDTIYGTLRNTAHYHHQIVALTYYSTNYADQTTTQIIGALDQVIAARTLAWGGAVADGFQAFAVASASYNGDPCAAGLLIRLSLTTCDVHPSVKGRDILASAVLAVVRRNLNKSIAA